MAEDVDSNLIRQTKEALSKHIKKPPLHEKFLKKPPFRFLQDIIKSIVKETKFLEGKFSDEDFDTAKDRDSKVQFLDKLITEIETITGKKAAARPAKIVAGLDVNKTLELLILLAQAVDKNNNLKSKKQSSDKIQEEKKPKVVEKDQKKEEEKKAGSKISETASKDSTRKVPDRSQTTKDRRTVAKPSQPVENKDRRRSTAGQKPPSKKEEEKKPSPSKKKLEKVSSRTKDEPSQADSKKALSEEKDANNAEDVKTKNKSDEQAELVALNEKENETKNHTNRNDKDVQESTETKNQGTAEQVMKKQEQEKKPAEGTKETKKTVDNVKEQKKPVDNTKEIKEMKKLADNTKTKSSELAPKETLNKAPEKTKIPSTFEKVSDSGKVTSATAQRQEMNQKGDSLLIKDMRPLKRVFTPEKSAKQRDELEKPVNIFTESQDGKDDADDMFMPETQYVSPTNNLTAENKGDYKEQGQLVSQIIDTKKQLESKDSETKTKIQWEESANWRKSSGEKEVGGVKMLIQQLTKNAGPLGQLLIGLQEDLDEMMQELTQWRQINAQLVVETKKEKELTNELVKPLMKQLEELQQVEYPQEMERVKAARMAVYNNDKKIEEMLGSRTK